MTDITKGMTVYSLNIGNAARHREQVLTEMVVTRVGRKYFYVVPVDRNFSYLSETKYHLNGLHEVSDYTANSCIYLSTQEYEDEKEYNIICKNLYETFGQYNRIKLSLDTLRKIQKLIEVRC